MTCRGWQATRRRSKERAAAALRIPANLDLAGAAPLTPNCTPFFAEHDKLGYPRLELNDNDLIVDYTAAAGNVSLWASGTPTTTPESPA